MVKKEDLYIIGCLLTITFIMCVSSLKFEKFEQYDRSSNHNPPNGNWFPENKKKFPGFIR